MAKPSVLIINRIFPPLRGATGRMAQDVALALSKSGWTVTVLTTGSKAGKEKTPSFGIIRVKGSDPSKPRSGLSTVMILWRMFWRGLSIARHDVVITMTDPPMLVCIGRRLADIKKSSHVHWCQDLYPDLLKPLGVTLPNFLCKFFMASSRRAMTNAKAVVTIGRCMEKRLIQTGVGRQGIQVIPNWADLEVVAPLPHQGKNFIRQAVVATAKKPEEMFRNDSPKFRVLYAGNIGRAHPMRSVLDAAELLLPYPEIEFVFIGDPDNHTRLVKERGKRGLENIKFLPFQPIERLRAVMESGDLHLVTMRGEVEGMLVPCKFYSGMAVGRPTIFVGPQSSEIGQVLSDYGCGHCVSPTDAQGLADLIYGYRINGEAWFSAQEGALRAAQIYHPNQSLNRWVDLMNKIYKGR